MLVVIAVVLWPAAARAELSHRVGVESGGSEIGERSLSGLGLSVGVERRYRRTAIAAELSYAGLIDNDVEPWHGRMVRAAGTMRMRLAAAGGDALVMDASLDLGAGAHVIEWSRGGVLYRPELLVGISGTLGPRFGNTRFGDFVALHLMVTRGPGCVAGCADELQLGIQVSVGMFVSD
jgi:hypothetical protein